MFAWFVCSTPVEEVKKLTLITAIKTPYLEDGRFDLPAFDRLTNLQIQRRRSAYELDRSHYADRPCLRLLR